MIVFILFVTVDAKTFYERLLYVLFFALLAAELFYIHNQLVEHLLKHRKFKLYVSALLLHFLAGMILYRYGLQFLFGGYLAKIHSSFTAVFFILTLSIAISYSFKGIIAVINYEVLKRLHLESEMSLLQSQLNPHFLFNTLNNIYSQNLIDHTKSNEMIMQLSELMRYQIDSSKKKTVLIEEEINFITSFIELERCRLSNNMTINTRIEVADYLEYKLPPLIFIPFIENALKYGVSKHGSAINIDLEFMPDQIYFVVSNQIIDERLSGYSTNIGLENTKKRLNLLFPNKHELNISAKNNLYTVTLNINIK